MIKYVDGPAFQISDLDRVSPVTGLIEKATQFFLSRTSLMPLPSPGSVHDKVFAENKSLK